MELLRNTICELRTTTFLLTLRPQQWGAIKSPETDIPPLEDQSYQASRCQAYWDLWAEGPKTTSYIITVAATTRETYDISYVRPRYALVDTENSLKILGNYSSSMHVYWYRYFLAGGSTIVFVRCWYCHLRFRFHKHALIGWLVCPVKKHCAS